MSPPSNPDHMYVRHPQWSWFDAHGTRQVLSLFPFSFLVPVEVFVGFDFWRLPVSLSFFGGTLPKMHTYISI